MGNVIIEMIGEEAPLPTFFKNQYDSEGSIYEKGYWLTFGSISIKIAENDDGLGKFIDHINDLEQEMLECVG